MATTDNESQYQDLLRDQRAQAKQFRNVIAPSYGNFLGSQAESEGGQKLADTVRGIRQKASSRGLLHSGLRQGAESGAYGETLNDINRQKMAINQKLQEQADEMENQSLMGRLGGYESDIKSEFQKYQERAQRAQNEQAQRAGMFGNILGIGGMALGAFSDKDLKEDIKSGDSEAKAMLDAISAKTYEYKNKDHGDGKQLGPIAQDLEKSEVGKSFVKDTSEGKMIDYGKGFNALLASQAALNKRLKDLERGQS